MMTDKENFVSVYLVSASVPDRQRLLKILSRISAAKLVGVASNAVAAAENLEQIQPDLLLLDIGSDRGENSVLQSYLAHRMPRCKVIALPTHFEAHWRRPGVPPAPDTKEQEWLRLAVRSSLKEKTQSKTPNFPPPPATAMTAGADHMRFRGEKMKPAIYGISERRRRHIERRRSEISRTEAASCFVSLATKFPGFPYMARLDESGSNLYVSPKIEELLGFTPEQWCGDPAIRLRQLHPEDRDAVLAAIAGTIAAPPTDTAYCLEYRIFAVDGTMHWLRDEAHVVYNDAGLPLFLQGVALDITERKQAQKELERSHGELQRLVNALELLRVEEQRKLAHEMHDDFGQLLAAMKMDISALRQHLPPDNTQLVKYLGSINELVDTMVMSVRRIIADLPPKMLEDLGLFHALESMLAAHEKRYHIPCHLQLPSNEPEIATRIRIALYRMAQEIFNNIAKHAMATCVDASVRCGDGFIMLEVRDNGIGMTAEKLHKPGSFGLIGMHERVAALGGNMTIDSDPGRGTAILIIIPTQEATTHGFQER